MIKINLMLNNSIFNAQLPNIYIYELVWTSFWAKQCPTDDLREVAVGAFNALAVTAISQWMSSGWSLPDDFQHHRTTSQSSLPKWIFVMSSGKPNRTTSLASGRHPSRHCQFSILCYVVRKHNRTTSNSGGRHSSRYCQFSIFCHVVRKTQPDDIQVWRTTFLSHPWLCIKYVVFEI